jgi:hypothetical protein
MLTEQSSLPSLEAPMNAISPFELLAQELGAVAGRIEREAAYRIAALIADVKQQFAESELRIERMQKALEGAVAGRIVLWDQMITDKVNSLHDGEDGIDGQDGKDGINGEEGKPGPQGEAGPSGPAGAQGLQGLPGDKGESGEAGQSGKDGIDGKDGTNGLNGKDGIDGANGRDGTDGEIGPQGFKGEDGVNGKDGAPGKLPKVKAWKEGSVHYDGEVVTHDGSLYQALKDTAKTPGTDEWICLTSRGLDGKDGHHGEDGISMNIRETFDPNEKYCELDVVTLDSKWFVAKYDNPGVCPGPGWKSGPGIGKTGKPGPQGERGLKGDPGPKPVEIIEWDIRAKTFEAFPIMSDGTLGPPLSLRELFAQFQMEAGNAF